MPTESMTIDQAVEYINRALGSGTITKSALYSMRWRNTGPACSRVTRRLMYRADDLDKWIATRLDQTTRGGNVA